MQLFETTRYVGPDGRFQNGEKSYHKIQKRHIEKNEFGNIEQKLFWFFGVIYTKIIFNS